MSTYPGGYDPAAFPKPFASAYRAHLQHLKLKGLQPKTIDAYARAIRRMGEFFDYSIDRLTNERDFPVPSEPRPVRVAVCGN
jgi:hypothetical protein